MSEEEKLAAQKVIEAMGARKEIRGDWWSITMTFQNDYVMKAGGELRQGGAFWVYKSSMKKWEPPHENDIVNEMVKNAIIDEVRKSKTPNSVDIQFV